MNQQVERSQQQIALAEHFNEDEITTIEQMGYAHIPANHIRVFFARAHSMGLNPNNTSQIALIERNSKNGPTYTLQVGIAGLRNGARRIADGKGISYSEGDWEYQGLDQQGNPTGWTDYWSPKWGTPEAARCVVTRDGQPFAHVVYWDEAVQTFGRSGDPTPMWSDKPLFMLGKNAAAGAFRKAFPDELSDVYLDSERFDSEEPVKATATRMDVSRGADGVRAALEKKKAESAPAPEPSQDDTAEYVAEVTEHLATLDSQDQVNDFMASLQSQDANLPEGVLAAGRARWEELN